MHGRIISVARLAAALVLVVSCGSTKGSVSPAADVGGVTNVWLPRAAATAPVLGLSFTPERLWLFGVMPAGDSAVLLVQADDNGNSFVSARDDSGERWRTTFDGMAQVVTAGGLALAAVGDRLLGLALDDGAVVVDDALIGGAVALVGDDVLTMTMDDDDAGIGWFDTTLLRIDPIAQLEAVQSMGITDRGLLVVGDDETTLIDLTDDSLTHWPATLQPVGGLDRADGIGLAVSGDLLIGLDGRGRLVAVDPAGTVTAVLDEHGDRLSDVWAAGKEVIVAVGQEGLSVLTLGGGRVGSVDHLVGPGRLGPTAVIDGTGYFTWYSDGEGRIFRGGRDGMSEVLRFAEQIDSDVADEQLPEQVTFVDAAVYVAHRRSTGGDRAQVLTAYALDGSRTWQIESPLEPEWVAQWEVAPGLVALRFGYVLIPGQVDIYR